TLADDRGLDGQPGEPGRASIDELADPGIEVGGAEKRRASDAGPGLVRSSAAPSSCQSDEPTRQACTAEEQMPPWGAEQHRVRRIEKHQSTEREKSLPESACPASEREHGSE